MGGRKKPITGYKNFLGIHFILGLGPADLVHSMSVAKKLLWQGPSSGGRILTSAPDLFGGDRREGGVSGPIDLMMGRPDQGENDYLRRMNGQPQPGYRGLISVVLRQCYLGTNPYIKPWEFRIQRIFQTDPEYNDGEQWYPEKAAIFQRSVERVSRRERIYIAIDVSESMNTITENGQTRLENVKSAVIAFLEERRERFGASRNIDIMIVAWAQDVVSSIQRVSCDVGGYNDLINYVSGLTNAFFNNLMAAISLSFDWFSFSNSIFGGGFQLGAGTLGDLFGLLNRPDPAVRRTMIILTDGESHPDAAQAAEAVQELVGVNIHCFAVDAPNTAWAVGIDNTPSDGVPVISGGSPVALLEALRADIIEYDANPAHIIREVLVSPQAGGTGDESRIGASFQEAADVLHDEQFGISIEWESAPLKRREFIQLIEDHIDAAVFSNRRTRLWEIKLIRDDFDFDELPVFDENNVVSWEGFEVPEPHTLVNSLTVTWSDATREDPSSRTLTNPARVLQVGRVNSESRNYPGIWRSDLAGRVAVRDLIALSNPLRRGTVVATFVPLDINRGSAIRLHNPKFHIFDTVFRVLEIKDGNGRDTKVRMSVVEDKFALASSSLDEVEFIEPAVPQILSPVPRLVAEAPYFEVQRVLGQEVIDEVLSGSPDVGYLLTAAGSPSGDSVNALVNVDQGSGYFETGAMAFSGSSIVRSVVSTSASEAKLLIDYVPELVSVEYGSLAQIGDEVVRIDQIEAPAIWGGSDYWAPDGALPNDVVLLTVGRGCLDTVPQGHLAGSDILFWQAEAEVDDTRYVDGESLDVKLLTVTARGEQDIDSALVDTLTFSSRAIRPYPPGNFRLNGLYEVPDLQSDVILTWAHRDRLFQTTLAVEDHTAGNIGPEAGTTYRVRVEALDNLGAVISTVTDENVGGVTTYDWDDATPLPAGVSELRFSVTSVRDGYESWQSPSITMQLLQPPGNLLLQVLDPQPPSNLQLTVL